MEIDYATIDEPATPEYVLAVFKDLYFQTGGEREEFTFETTVDEWELLMDWESWRGFNELWGLNCKKSEWLTVLKPARKRTLRDLCEFIAVRVKRPRVRPSRIFGCPGGKAGAFLTIRSILHRLNVPVEDISPSTPLGAYPRKGGYAFVRTLALLAPGVLPTVRVSISPRMGFLALALADLLVGSAGLCDAIFGGFPQQVVPSALVALTGFVGTWICLITSPVNVRFGDLHTFRDLAVAVDAATAEK